MSDSKLYNDLNKQRKKSLFFFVLTIVLASIIGAAGFAFIITGCLMDGLSQILFLSFGFPLFFGGSSLSIVAYKISLSYKKLFYESLTGFLGKSFKRLSFSFKKDVEDVKRLSSCPAETPKIDDDETIFYEGELNDGTKFFSYFVQKTVVGPAHPYNVRCRYLEFALADPGKHSLLVLPQKEKPIFHDQNATTKLRSESISFSDRYDAYATNELEGAMALPPSLIDFLGSSPYSFSICHHEGSLRVFLEGMENVETPSLSRPVKESSIDALRQEASVFSSFYKAIKGSL